MNPTLRNVLAVIAGYVIGSAFNMGILFLGLELIPPPDGVDIMNMESLQNGMHLFEPKHFLTPFLAHAVGTAVGVFVAIKIAMGKPAIFAGIIGALFLAGGIYNVFTLPSPTWFSVVDLIGAYIPMAWIGWRLASK